MTINRLSDDYSAYDGDVIQFDTVKALQIHVDDQEIAEKIAFKKVQTISLDIETEFNDKWMDFVNRQLNEDLCKLHLYPKMITKDQLLNLAQKLSMKSAKIECDIELVAEDVVNFLRNSNKKLEKFAITAKINETDRTELMKIISTEWDVQVDYKPIEFDEYLTELTMFR